MRQCIQLLLFKEQSLQSKCINMNLTLHKITVIDHVGMNPGITAKGLRINTKISKRTLYSTIHRLVEKGTLIEKDSIKDARQRHYFIVKQ